MRHLSPGRCHQSERAAEPHFISDVAAGSSNTLSAIFARAGQRDVAHVTIVSFHRGLLSERHQVMER